MRVVPRACEEINETWIADRDRFSYEGIYSDDRLKTPQVRESDGSWREVPGRSRSRARRSCCVGRACNSAYSRIPRARSRSCICRRAWPRAWAVPTSIIVCDSGTFAIRPPMRARPRLGVSIAEIEQLDCAADGRLESAARGADLAHRVRKAALRGTRVSFINPAQFEYLFPLAQ